jgi:hypothetical protein
MDIRAPYPWARAHNRPLNGKLINIILLFFTLCILFAPRDYQDTHAEKTRTTSVIYPQRTTDYEKNEYHKYTYHGVFFNTERCDIYPYASPEGAKLSMPRGVDRRLQNGTLGAVMRLKALS